jgi:hypothetical protein
LCRPMSTYMCFYHSQLKVVTSELETAGVRIRPGDTTNILSARYARIKNDVTAMAPYVQVGRATFSPNAL